MSCHRQPRKPGARAVSWHGACLCELQVVDLVVVPRFIVPSCYLRLKLLVSMVVVGGNVGRVGDTPPSWQKKQKRGTARLCVSSVEWGGYDAQ